MTHLRERETYSSYEFGRNSLEKGFWLRPFRMALGNSPTTDLQKKISDMLVDRLTQKGAVKGIVDLPQKTTPLEEAPQMVMIHGRGWDSYCEDSFGQYMDAPDSAKPRFFMLNTTESLPPVIDLDSTRQQLARSACHEGVVFVGNPNGGIETITHAIWISMQRNYKVFDGSPEKIIDKVVERIPYHFGTDYMNRRQFYTGEDGTSWLDWERWAKADFHLSMKNFALALGEAGIIGNEVNLYQYCQDNRKHGRKIYYAINQSLGESMMGIGLGGDFRVYAVSRSGADKVNWDPSPLSGYLIPVSHITSQGCIIMRPDGSPESLSYGRPSVESREGALAHVAKQLINMGVIADFEGLYRWHQNTFADPDMIVPVFLPGLGFPGLVIEHNHNHVEAFDPSKVEVAIPDERLFGSGDQPCGSEGGQWALLEGLFQLKCFTSNKDLASPLGGKIGVVQFSGHGMVLVAETVEAAQDALLHYMRLKEPPSV